MIDLKEEELLSPNWKLIQSKGAKKVVHARGCPYIKDWTIEGVTEIANFRPGKQNTCKHCEKLAYVTMGAKDYHKKFNAYRTIFDKIPLETVAYFYKKHAKTTFQNDKLYVQCHKDNWYIDLSLGEVHLFHNNYAVNRRNGTSEQTSTWQALGYHEHPLNQSVDNVTLLNDCLLEIADYKYEKAMDIHNKNRKKKAIKRFSDLDNYDEYTDLKVYGF